ncbi:MAG: Sec-independent protein translocase protein TatB [Proteobacteria bacterium]|nr:Sec-independent protein translocase protein TatB [Pseudomonadota bacterium]MDA1153966.1 Sec-independent protein translocase protein TatB [Pseudomonadota bacterium]
MFGLGMSEMVLIGIVALIVIGPKDLPGMFRTLGQFTGKARGMAREFSRAMEAAADESGIKDVSKTIRAASDPKKFGADALKDATSFTKGPATQELAAQRKAAKAKADDLAKTTQENAARAAVKAAPATPSAPKPAAPADVADTPKDKA